jgi:pyruvate kinase
MLDAGMDGCRLNMSHCSHKLGNQLVERVRRAAAEIGRPAAIGADLKGPKLRIGEVAGGSVVLEEGSRIRVTPKPQVSDAATVSVDYRHLAEDVREGDPILLNDGFIVLRVEEIAGGCVSCRVEKGGTLTSRKGVNLPGVPLRVSSLTEKDLADLAFAVDAGVDFLYLSYARSAAHVQEVRSACRGLGRELPVVAKIERQEGVDRLAEIVGEADGVCVARGDLGIEVAIGMVPGIQRDASRLCQQTGKLLMNGGQLLASMVSSPLPLRAEVSDLSTAVRDNLDAIILSDETASGAYPVEAVRVAAHVLEFAERYQMEHGRDSASDSSPDRGKGLRDGALFRAIHGRG